MIPWFPQSLAVSQRHHGVSLSVSPGGPVPSKASCGGDCCGLLQLPLPSEIDELIVGLLPVCLCPGRRRPGYGWESQLWHPPWGYYCSCPAGGPGGWWPREQLWPTYCCHTPGDTAALSPTWTSDWLRQNDSLWSAAIPQGNYLIVPNFSWWQQLGKARRERRQRSMFFPPIWPALSVHCPRPPVHVQ